MSFEKLFKRTSDPSLSDSERRKAAILILEPDQHVRHTMKQQLIALGYGTIADATDHLQALKKLEERKFTHLIFEAKRTNMPTKEFLQKTFELDASIIAVASSYEPNVDDVFNLLVMGARGYLVKPITQGSLDDTIVMATKGEPISDSILNAKSRNEALAALVVSAFSKLAAAKRQAVQFETAKREVPLRMNAVRRAVDIATTFAEGGSENWLDSLIELCLERGQGPASRLGRVRKRIDAKKLALAQRQRELEPADSENRQLSAQSPD